jgi:hypothetical protein
MMGHRSVKQSAQKTSTSLMMNLLLKNKSSETPVKHQKQRLKAPRE